MSDNQGTDKLLRTLSIDLGNKATKQSLSWHNDAGELQLHRIPFSGSSTHPNHPQTFFESVFDCIACAGLDEHDNIVVGGAALEQDTHFSIKTAVLYRAVGKKSAIAGLPDSPDLLDAIDAGKINEVSIDNILRQHLEYLQPLAVNYAKEHNVKITRISLTYACYLPNEQENHFDLFMDYYLDIAKYVWGNDLRYETCSEGQSTANYICMVYNDPLRGKCCNLMKDLFPKVFWGKPVLLIVADSGSSSLNLQMVYITLDPEGNMQKSFSIVIDGLKSGVKGGSDLVNSEIKGIVKDSEELKTANLQPGDIAAYVQDFERKKRRLDYVAGSDDQLTLVLQSNREGRTPAITLKAKDVRECFDRALNPGIGIIRIANECALELDSDFVVLFCGGTSSNPGYQRRIDEDMKRLQTRAGAKGRIVHYRFLSHRESFYWSSVQSAGGSLAVQSMPSPLEVLRGSAIGIQEQSSPKNPASMWKGASLADFLVCEACASPEASEHKIPRGKQARQKLRLALVCDPKYLEQTAKEAGGASTFPPIRIARPKDVIIGPHWTYDLGWTIPAEDLPDGNVLVTISGSFIDSFAAGAAGDKYAAAEGLDFVLSCSKVDRNGIRVRDDLDKKWHLSFRTDATSGFIAVRLIRKLPFWCSICRQEIRGIAMVCADCDKYSVCLLCHMRKPHMKGHEVERVDMNV